MLVNHYKTTIMENHGLHHHHHAKHARDAWSRGGVEPYALCDARHATKATAQAQLGSFSTPVGEPSMGTYCVVGRTCDVSGGEAGETVLRCNRW